MAENFRDLSLNGIGNIFSDALSPYSEFRPVVTALSVVQQMDQPLPERSRYASYKIEVLVKIPLRDLEQDDKDPF